MKALRRGCTKSPRGPVMMRVIGKNMVAMAVVAMNMGMNSSLALVVAALKGSMPWLSLSI